MPGPLPPILAIRSAGSVDPHGAGAVYLVENWPAGPKRWINDPAYLAAYVAVCGPVRTVNALLLDRCKDDAPIGADYVAVAPSTYVVTRPPLLMHRRRSSLPRPRRTAEGPTGEPTRRGSHSRTTALTWMLPTVR